MIEKELLELAAKAAGRAWLSYHHKKGLCCRDHSYGGLIEYYWNPLTDDGDALRLAVKMGIDVTVSGKHAAATSYIGGKCFQEYANGDLQSATRRAIVRAAAEIGKSL